MSGFVISLIFVQYLCQDIFGLVKQVVKCPFLSIFWEFMFKMGIISSLWKISPEKESEPAVFFVISLVISESISFFFFFKEIHVLLFIYL